MQKKLTKYILPICVVIFAIVLAVILQIRIRNSAAYSLTNPDLSASTGNISKAMVGSKLNINAATAEELTLLPGIGPSLSERIITYRNNHGPFATIDELTQVKGIGPAIIESIKPYIITGES